MWHWLISHSRAKLLPLALIALQHNLRPTSQFMFYAFLRDIFLLHRAKTEAYNLLYFVWQNLR